MLCQITIKIHHDIVFLVSGPVAWAAHQLCCSVGVHYQDHSILLELSQEVADKGHHKVPFLGANHPCSRQWEPTQDGMVIGLSNLWYVGETFHHPRCHARHQSRICSLHTPAEAFQILLHVAGHSAPCAGVAVLHIDCQSEC